MCKAAEIRAKLYIRSAISARSRRPTTVEVSMLASSCLGFVAVEHRGLALFHDVLRAAHGGGRVLADHLADDEEVEQHADRREVLLHRRGFVGFGQHLDVGRDVVRADAGEIGRPVFLAPGEEARIATAYAARVLALRMLAVKKSTKRSVAASPRSAITRGTTRAPDDGAAGRAPRARSLGGRIGRRRSVRESVIVPPCPCVAYSVP